MNSAQMARLAAAYPVLADPSAQLLGQCLTDAAWLQVPAGTRLFEEGAPCQGFPLVLSGSIQLELYRVTPGEICVVSMAGLAGASPLSAHGVTLDATELVLMSAAGFDRASAEPGFRRYVFGVFAERLADLMGLAEAVAFQRVDQRLAQALLGHGGTIRITHQALADELGTVREIVTRLLSRFERAGWVRLARERIDILDAPALRAVAAGHAQS
jgi:CRP/FNR family transcriptional regulator, anaerobic regulatory protein